MAIDTHSHLLQGRHACSDLPQSLDDLDAVDMAELVAGLDQLGVEAVVTLAQEMTRVRDQWLGSNKLAADLRGCGWPTLSTAQIEGLLGENIRRFLNL